VVVVDEICDDGREEAVLAQSIGFLAVIGCDLEEALLGGGGFWQGIGIETEESLSGEAENLIFLGLGPLEVAIFHGMQEI